MKNWKNLFVKSDEPEVKSKETEPLSFPSSNNRPVVNQATEAVSAKAVNDPALTEVLQVYEKGLESINMPGYDFYEFYQAISSTGVAGEQTYNMAYKMARSLDKTITTDKLLHDAEFYISKINEVHGQYVSKGQQKLNALQEQKNNEKNKLTAEIDQASARITQLKAELQQLESEITQKKTAFSKIEEDVYPKEKAVREKLLANDMARKNSIDQLNTIKEGIQRLIK